MSTFKKIVFISLCFAINSLLSQNQIIKKANTHLERLEYKNAAQLYERALAKNINQDQLVHNLAFCYLKLNDMPSAEKWLTKSVTLKDAKSEEYLQLAEVLKENKKYKESEVWFEKYNLISDKKNKHNYESDSDIKEYYSDSSLYKVSFVSSINSKGSDFSPCYFKDGLIYVSERDHDKYSTSEFMWDQSHYLDLYYAEFENNEGANFKKEKPFNAKLNTKYHEGPIATNKDQTFLVFTRNNYFQKKAHLSTDGINKLKLFYNEFKDGKWSSTKNFPFNNDQYSCGHPALTSDGKTLFFVSDMEGGIGGTDLWKCTYENGKWTKPENLGDKINTPENEMFPTLINDSVFYFSSNGLGGLGGLDVFSASYIKEKIGNPKNMGYPINSNRDDFGLIYDAKSETGFFTSNRENSSGGSDDIYFFKIQGNYLTILVVDEKTKLPLSKGSVTYTLSEKTYSITTDDKGKVKINLKPKTDLSFIASYSGYINESSSISTSGQNAKKNLELVIPLKRIDYNLIATVTDGKTKKYINEVSIKLVDELNNKIVFADEKTNAQGSIIKKLIGKVKGDKIAFEISLKKEKYLSKTEYFEIVLGDEPTIQIPLKLLELDQISVGTDIGKLIDIKPIYFDVDKSEIRFDASLELDKMVKVMIENPNIIIELGSHTDCRASYKYNMSLSDKRAKASAAYIISKGIDKKRIYGKGYGESKLINKCACEGAVSNSCSEEEHQLNRRTEFKIVKM